jgi:hypothetical protein
MGTWSTGTWTGTETGTLAELVATLGDDWSRIDGECCCCWWWYSIDVPIGWSSDGRRLVSVIAILLSGVCGRNKNTKNRFLNSSKSLPITFSYHTIFENDKS